MTVGCWAARTALAMAPHSLGWAAMAPPPRAGGSRSADHKLPGGAAQQHACRPCALSECLPCAPRLPSVVPCAPPPAWDRGGQERNCYRALGPRGSARPSCQQHHQGLNLAQLAGAGPRYRASRRRGAGRSLQATAAPCLRRPAPMRAARSEHMRQGCYRIIDPPARGVTDGG
jgi:hypothetical protein